MYILGIYIGHDSHYCLLRDGEVVSHWQTERFTRRKHEGGFHETLLERFLDYNGVSYDDIELFVNAGYATQLMEGSDKEFYNAFIKETVLSKEASNKILIQNNYANDTLANVHEGVFNFRGKARKCFSLTHHLSHLALAYYSSPYVKAKVFSVDGGGDGAYIATCKGENGRLIDVEYNLGYSQPKRPSIGGVWDSVIKFAAKAMNGVCDAEGKIMALASYGKVREEWLGKFYDWFSLYDQTWFDKGVAVQPVLDYFEKQVDFSDARLQSLQDYAASLQYATEDYLYRVIKEKASPGDNICYTGGVAYNCAANGKIFKRYPNIFVPNCPNDGGLAVGACQYVWHHVLGNVFNGVAEFSPYKGRSFGEADISIVPRVVDDILAGKIVAWFNGASENGARALGNRSFLVDARRADVQKMMNDSVKKREWYRPFAPSVLDGETSWCDGGMPNSKYMSFVVKVNDSWCKKIPAATHVDATCRPQVVSKSINPVYHEIIRQFHDATGVPMILNTSFNIQEPIIDSPDNAESTFWRSNIDILYINGRRISKNTV